MPEGPLMLLLVIYLLVASLWHGAFIRIANAFIVKSDLSYGEAFQVAFLIAVVTTILGGAGNYCFEWLAIQMGEELIDYVGKGVVLIINAIAGIVLISKMVRDNQLKPIGFKRGFLVWLVSYLLWAAVCLACFAFLMF